MSTPASLQREVFALAYHLKWSASEILGLSLPDRHAYLRLLADQLDAERRAADEAAAR